MFKQTLALVGLTFTLSANAAVYVDSFEMHYSSGSILTFAFDDNTALNDGTHVFTQDTSSADMVSIWTEELLEYSLYIEVVGEVATVTGLIGPLLDTSHGGHSFVDLYGIYLGGGPTGRAIDGLFNDSVVGSTLAFTSAVPVPAAGWLFMSGLIALVGKKRLARQ